MAQWLDEGYLVEIGGQFFQRLQLRRVGDWVEFRGAVEWDGNSLNPNNPSPTSTDDIAEKFVTEDSEWQGHGPLPEEYRPPGGAYMLVPTDPVNTPNDRMIARLQILDTGEMQWESALLAGDLAPLTVFWFDGCRYHVGNRNDEVPPEGYVQHWPNP